MAHEWPTLPQIERPRGALATAFQTQRLVPEAFPRGAGYRGAQQRRVSRREPGPDAAPWFKQLYRAWMAARAPQFATAPRQWEELLQKEDAELQAAAFKAGTPAALAGPDESLPERRVALTLLLPTLGVGRSNTLLLDGLAHWVSAGNDPLVRSMRITVLAGEDAEEFRSAVAGQAVGLLHAPNSPEAHLVLRWIDDQRALRTQSIVVDPASTAAQAAGRLHQLALALGVSWGTPLPAATYVACPPNAGDEAFAYLLLNACDGFFADLHPRPMVAYDGVHAQRQATDPLATLNVFVRERAKVAMAPDDCHPGVLLAPASHVAGARAYCARFSGHALALPDGHAENAPAPHHLHVCVVRATMRRFGPNISLYALGGVPGAPTSAGGSFAWQVQATLAPISTRQLELIDLIPCTAASLRPGAPTLEPFFRTFFGHAVKLYKSIGAPPPPAAVVHEPTPWLESGGLDEAAASPNADMQFVLTALRLDLHSPNCTIGEALVHLLTHPDAAAPAFVGLLKSAARALGVETPLLTMLERLAQTLDATPAARVSACAPAPAVQCENARLQAVCNAVLRLPSRGLPPPASATPRAPTTRAATAAIIRRVARGCKLHTRHEAMLPRSGALTMRAQAVLRVVDIVHHAVTSTTTLKLGTIEQCERLLDFAMAPSAEPRASWRRKLVLGVRGVLDVMGALDPEAGASSALFFVHTDVEADDAHELVLERVLGVGAYEPSSTDQVLSTPTPRLLALQITKDTARLTACA